MWPSYNQQNNVPNNNQGLGWNVNNANENPGGKKKN